MHTEVPDIQRQLEYINELIDIDEDTVIFGHSLGCLLVMRVSEKRRYKKMFLVAGWDFDDLTKEHRLFWPNKIDHAEIKENVKEIYWLSSDNDSYMTEFAVEEMSKRLGGEFVLIKGAGYFTQKESITKIPVVQQFV